MENKAGIRGDSQPESPASAGSGSVDLTQFDVRTTSPTHSVQGHVSPARSVGGFSQTEGMSEKMRFKLEMRMKLEAEKEK